MLEGTLPYENIRFSSLFAAADVSRETSTAVKSEENRMFSQAKGTRAQYSNQPYFVSQIVFTLVTWF